MMQDTRNKFWDETDRVLKAFVYRRVRDKTITDDIVQDVLVKVHSRLGQLRDTERMTPWIYQIARNAIADHFRAGPKSIKLSDLNWESNRQDFNECVGSCLGEMLLTLPQKYRQALELAEIEQLSQTELARRLQISYSGAKSRVQRARRLLREKMDEAYVIKTDAYGNVVVCENRIPCHCPEADGEFGP